MKTPANDQPALIGYHFNNLVTNTVLFSWSQEDGTYSMYVCITWYGVQVNFAVPRITLHTENYIETVIVVAHTHCFNGHFPGKAGCMPTLFSTFSHSYCKHPYGQVETLHSLLLK